MYRHLGETEVNVNNVKNNYFEDPFWFYYIDVSDVSGKPLLDLDYDMPGEKIECFPNGFRLTQ